MENDNSSVIDQRNHVQSAFPRMAELDEVDLPGYQRTNIKMEQSRVNDAIDSSPNKSPCVKDEKYDEVPSVNDSDEKNGLTDEVNASSYKTSLSIFHEDYDDLDETDYPHPDPCADPDVLGVRKLRDLDLKDFPIMNRSKLKTKTIVRSQNKLAGIISTHTTYFPPKINQKHVELCEEYASTDSSCHYDMSSFPRGIFTIFNVEHYLHSTGMADYPRKGTERDAEALCALFLELGFIVERYDNPSKKVMLDALDRAASGLGSLSCCACSILTHGEEGILYSSDSSILIKDITKAFRKKSLAGKPKLFLFQACQGSDYMDAIDACDGPRRNEDDALSLPCEADFFYAYSTVPGYYSWRNSRNGSWFMQSLCQIFRQNAHMMDLYRMLTRVNDKVSGRKSRTDDRATDDKRQIAALVSQMRKELFFFPPYGPLVT